MNRKHNPWLALVALLLLVTLLACICTGCTEASAETQPRFIVESAQAGTYETQNIAAAIILDTETGVRYLYCIGPGGISAGLTRLEEGTP